MSEVKAEENEVRMIRHELRTPVNHIVGYAELLLDDERMDVALAQGLRQVRDISHEVLALVAGKSPTDKPDPITLDEVVTRLEQAIRLLPAVTAPAIRQDMDRIGFASARLRSLVTGLSADASFTTAKNTTDPSGEKGEGAATILVVDDDEGNREVLSRRLVRLGYRVIQAVDGRPALVAMAHSNVDLVLLDLMMPDMDGFAVLEKRRDDSALRDIPVIMISAADQAGGIIRCIELGAADYLSKPFDPVLLKARIGACLEKKRLRDQEKELLATVSRQAAELAAWNRELEKRVEEKVEQLERLSQMERFLPPQLAQAIANGGEAVLRSHRSEITVLFCDLRGFTAFSESAEPEDVMGVLREMHDAVGPLVFELGGTLAQFTGDGMMVFFNDPVPCEDPAWQAVQLGLGMRSRVELLSAKWRRRGHHLRLGVGIAIGHATCGQYGFDGRFEYSAIGHVTNLAARLCGEAKGGQVLVTERISNMIEDRVEIEQVGELVLKGMTRPVAAFNVVAVKV